MSVQESIVSSSRTAGKVENIYIDFPEGTKAVEEAVSSSAKGLIGTISGSRIGRTSTVYRLRTILVT